MIGDTFVLASNNAHKLTEFRAIFKMLGLSVISAREANAAADPEENGATFAENAMIKARAIYDLCGLPTVADDSGLCVDALDGAPGIYSARFGGFSEDADHRKLLLEKMKNIPEKDRTAHFTSVIACILPDGGAFCVEGICPGRIAFEERGENGFGYDSLFLPDGEGGKTFAELPPSRKNTVSHRARALAAFAAAIKEKRSNEV